MLQRATFHRRVAVHQLQQDRVRLFGHFFVNDGCHHGLVVVNDQLIGHGTIPILAQGQGEGFRLFCKVVVFRVDLEGRSNHCADRCIGTVIGFTGSGVTVDANGNRDHPSRLLISRQRKLRERVHRQDDVCAETGQVAFGRRFRDFIGSDIGHHAIDFDHGKQLEHVGHIVVARIFGRAVGRRIVAGFIQNRRHHSGVVVHHGLELIGAAPVVAQGQGERFTTVGKHIVGRIDGELNAHCRGDNGIRCVVRSEACRVGIVTHQHGNRSSRKRLRGQWQAIAAHCQHHVSADFGVGPDRSRLCNGIGVHIGLDAIHHDHREQLKGVGHVVVRRRRRWRRGWWLLVRRWRWGRRRWRLRRHLVNDGGRHGRRHIGDGIDARGAGQTPVIAQRKGEELVVVGQSVIGRSDRETDAHGSRDGRCGVVVDVAPSGVICTTHSHRHGATWLHHQRSALPINSQHNISARGREAAGGTRLCDCGDADVLAIDNSKELQRIGIFDRRHGDGQGRHIGVGTVRDGVRHQRHRAVVVGRRAERKAAVGRQRERAHTWDECRNTKGAGDGRTFTIRGDGEANDGGSTGPIGVDCIEQHVASDRNLFHRGDNLIAIRQHIGRWRRRGRRRFRRRGRRRLRCRRRRRRRRLRCRRRRGRWLGCRRRRGWLGLGRRNSAHIDGQVGIGQAGFELEGQRIGAFADAQQADKTAAFATRATGARAGCGGFEFFGQVAATVQSLDHAVDGAAAHAAFGRRGTGGGGEGFVDLDGLLGAQRQRAAVVHGQLDAATCAGDDGFTFLNLVADLQGPGLTVQAHHKGGASDGNYLCHGFSPVLETVERGYALLTFVNYWTKVQISNFCDIYGRRRAATGSSSVAKGVR